MNLDELAPRPNSKKLAEVTSKTFGYSVDLKSLDLPKAQQIKETFAKKLKKLNETLGAKVVSDKRYYEAKLVVETVDQFIREYNDGMSDEAHELVLFGENDGDLYNQRTVPIQKNLTKKWDKGTYDHDLAVKLWKYWADDAAMRYAKMHGSPNIKWSNMFSVADRMQAAEYMADNWEEELEAGNKMESASPVSEDSNYKIIMGFIDQWTEAGQPDDYMDDLVAYVKKTIPDSKDWNYAASLIKNGVESYQNREYGTSSLMGLRGKSMDEDKDKEPGTYIYSGLGSGTYYSVSGEKVSVSPQEASAMAEKEGVKFRYIDALDKRSIVAVKDSKTESAELTSESIIVEGEMEAAEVVMAARSVVDRIQGMLEDLGEIMNEDVPPLTDTITDQMGADMAAQYSTAVNGAVQAALDAVTQARAGADAAARMLTGESAPMMGEPAPEEMPMEPTTDMDMDMEQPIEEPADEGDEIATADAAQGGDEALGRARR